MRSRTRTAGVPRCGRACGRTSLSRPGLARLDQSRCASTPCAAAAAESVRRTCSASQVGERAAPTSALDPFKPYIVERLVELPQLTSIRLVEELRSRGCALGVAQLRPGAHRAGPAEVA